MRDGKKGCVHLISRVMNFLHLFVEDLKGSNVPVPDGSPTAARLFALKSNLKAIKADVMRWSDLGLLERYIKRDEINTGLSRHGENLTDCLSMLHLVASVRISNLADKIETVVFPGASVLISRKEEGEGALPSSSGAARAAPSARPPPALPSAPPSVHHHQHRHRWLCRAFTASSSVQRVRQCSSRLEWLCRLAWKQWDTGDPNAPWPKISSDDCTTNRA
ncbi:hypothetical protein BS47DRAFT_98264 [Hydnum rufescens UP504]|uniref:Uncharacterized protein n=1 Tax=Hydnum rufescens UP504 TaxID=1448309 RepID=A0A9P6AQJ0_9AGAM|nr:hypothetical protein BS47DRAFT_98264 [Hydnum rufescens UP504]